MNRDTVLAQLKAAENPTMVSVVVSSLIVENEELEAEVNHLRGELHQHHLVRDPQCGLCG